MAFFKVKPYCEFRVMIEGTTACRLVHPQGSVIELDDINQGGQACRLEPLSEEEANKILEEREKENNDLERIARDSVNASQLEDEEESRRGNNASAINEAKLDKAKRLLGKALK